MRLFLSFALILSIKCFSFTEASFKQEVEKIAKSYLKENSAGLSIYVIKASFDQDIPYEKVFHFGVAKKAPQLNIKDSSYFRIGNLSKSFLAALVCKLADKGLFQLTDPITKYLPKTFKMANYHGKDMTLLQLLNHLSSLPSVPTMPLKEYQVSIKEIENYLRTLKLPKEPGSFYEESDLGYGLLAYIIEKITRTSYAEILESELLKPLNIESVQSRLPLSLLNRLCAGYRGLFPVKEHFVDKDFGFFKPSRGLVSNMEGLKIWLKFLLKIDKTPLDGLLKTLLQPSYVFPEKQMQKAATAFTVIPLCNENSLTTYKLSSTYHGFSSFLAFTPDTKTGICMLSNIEADLEKLSLKLLQSLQN